MRIDQMWHLAASDDEVGWAECELLLWRAFNAFKRWQLECERMVNDSQLSADDLAVLHVIRMNDRSKTISEVSRLLNRPDYFNVNYCVSKLCGKGLVEKYQPVRNKPVQLSVTDEGRRNTDRYTRARREILFVELLAEVKQIDLQAVALGLRQIKGVYDEAHRVAFVYETGKERD